MYDQKCEDLAREFLAGSIPDALIDQHAPVVAQAIQDAAEQEVSSIEHHVRLEMEREEQRGSRCTDACGHCGACS